MSHTLYLMFIGVAIAAWRAATGRHFMIVCVALVITGVLEYQTGLSPASTHYQLTLSFVA